ncbi:16312_t:CDS:2, partial [Acaulospora morrowiae]
FKDKEGNCSNTLLITDFRFSSGSSGKIEIGGRDLVCVDKVLISSHTSASDKISEESSINSSRSLLNSVLGSLEK